MSPIADVKQVDIGHRVGLPHQKRAFLQLRVNPCQALDEVLSGDGLVVVGRVFAEQG